MLHQDVLGRINELALKKKTEGLTAEEDKERKELHQAYLKSFRSGFKTHLEGIKVVDDQGKDVTPEKLKQIQNEKGLHQRNKE